jgi:hypothetical protein
LDLTVEVVKVFQQRLTLTGTIKASSRKSTDVILADPCSIDINQLSHQTKSEPSKKQWIGQINEKIAPIATKRCVFTLSISLLQRNQLISAVQTAPCGAMCRNSCHCSFWGSL